MQVSVPLCRSLFPFLLLSEASLSQEAARLVQESCQVAQGNTCWQQGFQQQLQAIQQQTSILDRERQVVYFQPIAKQTSKLPQSKIIGTATRFEPMVLQHEIG